ncbi:integrase core domain-containing protein, partial [Aeromonas hydrophila]|uniref:integrase core domain-containing protein n=1 Tax=Aeromonas hydrophila TaxID=644 RepID=UPI00126A5829
LREWAYARSYESSEQRAEHLTPWLHEYNWHRPHASLNYQPPISRLPSVNNLVGLHN